ncbi:MAG TPA: hypothetical protein VFJ06_11625 [Halococcus sp.]|nr:hypothetical protein [Halococcus sp.]
MAEIVYEGPDGVLTVECDDVDHVEEGDVWRIEVGENEEGNRLHREIPRERVYYLEWSEDEEDTFLRH